MKTLSIRHKDGSVIWSGSARSVRQAVLTAVRSGVSLQGADLRRLNLSRLDLSGADMRDACLDDTDMRGAVFKNARLDRANLNRIRAEGAAFDFASMCGAHGEDAIFTGSGLVFADMRHSVFYDTLFTGSAMASARLSGSMFYRCSFGECSLQNASVTDSVIVECDFSGANLSHRAFSSVPAVDAVKLSAYLPNRTAGARVVGCTYSNSTVLSDTVPAMQADKRSTLIARYGLWAASTLGIVTAVEKGIEAAGEIGGHILGSQPIMAGGIIVVLAAATLLKESVVEHLREPAETWLRHISNKVREGIRNIGEGHARKWNLICLVGSQRSLHPVKMALNAGRKTAAEKGFFSGFKSWFSDTGEVVLCDRRHLAMALSTLCEARETGFHSRDDITFLYCDGHHRHEGSPCVMRISADGTSSGTWHLMNKHHVTVVYSSEGLPISAHDEKGEILPVPVDGLPEHSMHKVSAMLAFEAALLEKHGLSDFRYDEVKYRLEEGRKGAILVKRRSTGRLGNDVGHPAMIRIGEDPVYLRNGSVVAP